MNKTYIVTAALKFPSAYDRGYTVEISAKTKAQAISLARKKVRRECGYTRQDGPLNYSAEEAR